MIVSHLPMLTDTGCAGEGEDFIIWIAVQPLCVLATIRLFINDFDKKYVFDYPEACIVYFKIVSYQVKGK